VLVEEGSGEDDASADDALDAEGLRLDTGDIAGSGVDDAPIVEDSTGDKLPSIDVDGVEDTSVEGLALLAADGVASRDGVAISDSNVGVGNDDSDANKDSDASGVSDSS
jgi:hypothetical protein